MAEEISTHTGRYVRKATGDEARNYDFKAARGDQKTNGLLGSIGHLVKGCLGAGVVSVHEGYRLVGLWSALGLNIFYGFLVSYCVYILVKSAQIVYGRIQQPKMTYPDLAEASLAIGPFPKLRKFDKCFRYAVDFTICVDLFGSCCVYQVIIAKTVKQLIEGTAVVVDGAVGASPHIRIYILCLMFPCILLCMITQLKYLAPFSIVADVFIFAVAIATVIYALQANTIPASKFPVFTNVLNLFEYTGMCVFSMEGVGVSIAIENHMTNPHQFPIVLIGGMSIVTGVVATIGFFGYWGYGETAMSPVTSNFPLEVLPLILKIFMVLMVYVTFALNFWVPFELVWFYLKKKHAPNKYWLWERIYRAIVIAIITLIAVVFPNVGSFIGLLGSFCLSNMGFIYPAFIEIIVLWEDPGLGVGKWRLWKDIVIILFGILLCIIGTYTNGKALIEASFGTSGGGDNIVTEVTPKPDVESSGGL